MSESEPTESVAASKKPLGVFVVRDFEIANLLSTRDRIAKRGRYVFPWIELGVRAEGIWHSVETALRECDLVLVAVDQATSLRYVDDLYLFSDRRADLRSWRELTARWLSEERGLRLKSPQARIRSCRGHLDALGAQVTREGIAPFRRALAGLRAETRRQCHAREPALPNLKCRVASDASAVLWP
ncbi:MAG: hypothetical protein JNJ88_21130 [Planctomycetes bacterium]|nr:hypothetical protein [Planctomycetota bacterium]